MKEMPARIFLYRALFFLLTIFISLLVITPSAAAASLGDALDAPALTWTTGGDASWFGQTAVTKYGAAAAQSGPISHNQQTWMQTTVVGPGTLSFWWRVSSESNWDWLEFYINGVRQNRIAGNVSWQQKTYSLSTGTNVLQWRYVKDTSVNSGSDCGWVDKVVWTPTP